MTKAVWTVKGGRNGEREDRLIEGNLIGGGWEQLPSLEGVGSKEQLAEIYQAAYPEQKPSTVVNYVGQLWSLVTRMQDDELVVLPLKTTGTIAIGRVAGPYQYREDLGDDLRHCRPVNWVATDVDRDRFDQDLLYSFGAFLTFGRVKRENAEARILAASEGHPPTGRPDLIALDESESVEVAPDI